MESTVVNIENRSPSTKATFAYEGDGVRVTLTSVDGATLAPRDEHMHLGKAAAAIRLAWQYTKEPIGSVAPDSYEAIASTLATAEFWLRKGHVDSASWRLADATLRLRTLLEAEGLTNVPGLDVPTGKGALLSQNHIEQR
jgi:hypothetical protein